MNERERILDLVKQGVISSEEALLLLENLAKNTDPHAHTDRSDNQTADHEELDENEQELNAINTEIADVSGNLAAIETQLASLRKQVAANEEQIIVLDTMEDLDTLTQDKYQERGQLKQENLALNQEITELNQQRPELQAELADLEDQKKQLSKKRLGDVLPDDWQDQARERLNDFGSTMRDASSQIAHLVKDTVGNVMDNVDWKDITIKVPGLATEKFSQSFDYPDSKATILDLKVANGDVVFEPWDQPGFKIDADIKLYGKFKEDTPMEAFEARSRIDVNDDHLIFQVPNKRVSADLHVFFPDREYDHVTVRLLNGDVRFNEIHGKDFYVKSTNGDIQFLNSQVVMIEAQGVNGDIKVNEGSVHDVFLETVNGDIKLANSPETAQITTVNGTIRATYHQAFHTLSASSVNGDVKLAFPTTAALNGQAKARLGEVKSRLDQVPAKKNSKSVDLQRAGEGAGAITVSTTSGSILLKDSDQK